MTTFDDRDNAFENKYAHDEELMFKVFARRNKLLGKWAAAQLGKTGASAEQYSMEVVESDFEKPGDEDVIEKLVKDFDAAGVKISTKEIRIEMENLLQLAKQQILGDGK
jgi:hypothetical protein